MPLSTKAREERQVESACVRRNNRSESFEPPVRQETVLSEHEGT